MTAANMTRSRPGRGLTLTLAAIVGALVILLLTLVFEKGSAAAVMILDYSESTQLPYPFTIQNVMLMLFAIGVGDVLHRRTVIAAEAGVQSARLLPADDPRAVLTPNKLSPIQNAVLDLRSAGDDRYLVSLIEQCIMQFRSSRSIDDTHQMLTTMSDLEMHRVDLRYTWLRYVAWVIPTVGFIGTVLGIAQALTALKSAAGDSSADLMQLAIGPLAMAFNTTVMALLLSAILVLLIQFTQHAEEEGINAATTYCLHHLVNRLHSGAGTPG